MTLVMVFKHLLRQNQMPCLRTPVLIVWAHAPAEYASGPVLENFRVLPRPGNVQAR